MIRCKITSLLLCATLVVHGQQKVNNIERLGETRPWLHTANAAGLGDSTLPAAGQTWMGGRFVQGDFRRVQQPESTSQLLFFSEGYHPIQKGVIYGSFQYNRQQDRNIQFSDVMDPYRGTPYLLADSIGGDWKKQSYAMQVKAASGPLLHDQIRLGIGVNYTVATGARQNDPRPLNSVNDLSILPGLTWKVAGAHTIGVNGYYGSFRESVSLQLKNTNRTQNLYKLLGMGQYEIPTILNVSTVRNYNGNKYGGEFQYNYQHNGWQVLLRAGYKKYKEVATDGTSTPLKGGTLNEEITDAGLDLLYKRHHLRLDYIQYDRIGTETQYTRNRITNAWEITLEAPFTTSFVQHTAVVYEWIHPDWLLHAAINYNSLTNKYLLTTSSQNVDNLVYHLEARKSFRHLDLQLQGSYRQNLQQSLYYQLMTTTTNLIAYNILYPDHSYLSADAISGGLQAQYNFHYPGTPHTQFFVRVRGNLEQSLSNEREGNRTAFQFSIGAIY